MSDEDRYLKRVKSTDQHGDHYNKNTSHPSDEHKTTKPHTDVMGPMIAAKKFTVDNFLGAPTTPPSTTPSNSTPQHRTRQVTALHFCSVN